MITFGPLFVPAPLRAAVSRELDTIYGEFTRQVGEARKLDGTKLDAAASGRVFSGNDAKKAPHKKAIAAWKEGRFTSQVVPVEVPGKKKGEKVMFEKDESPREDTTLEVLRTLKPAFKKDGTVTAGNAPGVNDGAAALVVTSARRAKELGVGPHGCPGGGWCGRPRGGRRRGKSRRIQWGLQ